MTSSSCYRKLSVAAETVGVVGVDAAEPVAVAVGCAVPATNWLYPKAAAAAAAVDDAFHFEEAFAPTR